MTSSLPSAQRQAGRRLLSLFLLFAILTATFASPIALQERDDVNETVAEAKSGPFNISTQGWQIIVLGVLAILTGLYFCFLGYRYFRLTVFIVGFWFFGNIAYVVLVNAKVTDHTVLLIASIAIGIVCAALLSCCYQIGVYLLGALLGYLLALWILSFKSHGLIDSQTGQIILIVVLAVIGAVLAFFFERFILILATSFVGAFLVIFGIDLFVNTGYADIINGIINRTITTLDNEPWQVYAMIAATFVLFLIGVAVQYSTSWRTIGTGYRTGIPPYGWRRGKAPVAAPAPARRSWWPWRKRGV